METWPDLLARTYEIVRGPLTQFDESLLARPTPCDQWTVGELAEHVVTAINMFADAAGAPDPDERVAGDLLEQFDAAVARSLAAWTALSDSTVTLSLPFGDFPADLVVGMNQMDSLVHGWDLGASLGLAMTLPDDLCERALATAEVSVPPFRGHAFGAEVATQTTNAVDTLLAFTGRDSARWPGAIWVAGSLVTAKSSAGEPTASVVEIWEREGSGPPRHVHAEHDEIWYVLEGQFTFALGDREFRAGPGETVVGPRGVPHTFRADTARSRLLDIHTPGGFERFFVRAGRPAAALVPPPAAAPDASTLRATIEAFGATVVGPPLNT